ncbi:uncharacterized protein LOC113882815 [Bos indicus x Bos taurus]|uniref:uncharacterized protein LOC113882815 n=1 Tax=Bos indicus x Bos taurus TaxID=30522 RepID=UPI000F7D32AF|nr:uncharacterized protein LOC113882815 [Bos indicus x Bos taurus]
MAESGEAPGPITWNCRLISGSTASFFKLSQKKKRLRHFRVPSFSLIGETPPRPRARRALPLQGARLEALPHGPGGRKGRPQASWGETAPGSQHLRQGPLLPPRVRRRHFPGIRPPGKGRPHFQKRNFHSAPGSLTQPPPDSAPFPLHIQGSRAVLGEHPQDGRGQGRVPAVRLSSPAVGFLGLLLPARPGPGCRWSHKNSQGPGVNPTAPETGHVSRAAGAGPRPGSGSQGAGSGCQSVKPGEDVRPAAVVPEATQLGTRRG